MNIDKIMELKKKAPEDYKILFSAAKLAKDLNGFSATGDRETFEKIKKILDFEPVTKDGKILKKNIMAKAKAKSNKGMFGNGRFFID